MTIRRYLLTVEDYTLNGQQMFDACLHEGWDWQDARDASKWPDDDTRFIVEIGDGGQQHIAFMDKVTCNWIDASTLTWLVGVTKFAPQVASSADSKPLMSTGDPSETKAVLAAVGKVWK